MQNKTPIIEIRDLDKEHPSGTETLHVLRKLSLDIYGGEVVAIMGPSGTGKSTLLYILGMLSPASGGSYKINGRDVFRMTRSEQAVFRRDSLGYVFQSSNMLEFSTVFENLEYPLVYGGVPSRERPARIREALDRVGMAHRINHPANRLSGGEQQRVAIARALVNNPSIILADEPTGALDSKNSEMVMDYFRELVADSERAMIIVTHDPAVAARCTTVYVLRNGVLNQVDPGSLSC